MSAGPVGAEEASALQMPTIACDGLVLPLPLFSIFMV